MKSSTEDITARIDQTEAYIADAFTESGAFLLLWTFTVPAIFGIYTFYNGWDFMAFGFMVLGHGWGCATGSHNAFTKLRRRWFRAWKQPTKLPVRFF